MALMSNKFDFFFDYLYSDTLLFIYTFMIHLFAATLITSSNLLFMGSLVQSITFTIYLFISIAFIAPAAKNNLICFNIMYVFGWKSTDFHLVWTVQYVAVDISVLFMAHKEKLYTCSDYISQNGISLQLLPCRGEYSAYWIIFPTQALYEACVCACECVCIPCATRSLLSSG